MKLLLVEDDFNLGNSLESYLKNEGFEVKLCRSLKEARAVDISSTKAIVLDWMLPDGQGIDFLKELRVAGSQIPIILLTARDDLIDKVLGLESGANDYMTKPFEPRELVTRIRVQIRDFTPGSESAKIIEYGELKIDAVARKVFFRSSEVAMTKMEFDFLFLLAESPGRSFSREEILNKVWGFENYPSTRTVDTHVLQLRQKLSDEMIETVRGVGYRFYKNIES